MTSVDGDARAFTLNGWIIRNRGGSRFGSDLLKLPRAFEQ